MNSCRNDDHSPDKNGNLLILSMRNLRSGPSCGVQSHKGPPNLASIAGRATIPAGVRSVPLPTPLMPPLILLPSCPRGKGAGTGALRGCAGRAGIGIEGGSSPGSSSSSPKGALSKTAGWIRVDEEFKANCVCVYIIVRLYIYMIIRRRHTFGGNDPKKEIYLLQDSWHLKDLEVVVFRYGLASQYK